MDIPTRSQLKDFINSLIGFNTEDELYKKLIRYKLYVMKYLDEVTDDELQKEREKLESIKYDNIILEFKKILTNSREKFSGNISSIDNVIISFDKLLWMNSISDALFDGSIISIKPFRDDPQYTDINNIFMKLKQFILTNNKLQNTLKQLKSILDIISQFKQNLTTYTKIKQLLRINGKLSYYISELLKNLPDNFSLVIPKPAYEKIKQIYKFYLDLSKFELEIENAIESLLSNKMNYINSLYKNETINNITEYKAYLDTLFINNFIFKSQYPKLIKIYAISTGLPVSSIDVLELSEPVLSFESLFNSEYPSNDINKFYNYQITEIENEPYILKTDGKCKTKFIMQESDLIPEKSWMNNGNTCWADAMMHFVRPLLLDAIINTQQRTSLLKVNGNTDRAEYINKELYDILANYVSSGNASNETPESVMIGKTGFGYSAQKTLEEDVLKGFVPQNPAGNMTENILSRLVQNFLNVFFTKPKNDPYTLDISDSKSKFEQGRQEDASAAVTRLFDNMSTLGYCLDNSVNGLVYKERLIYSSSNQPDATVYKDYPKFSYRDTYAPSHYMYIQTENNNYNIQNHMSNINYIEAITGKNVGAKIVILANVPKYLLISIKPNKNSILPTPDDLDSDITVKGNIYSIQSVIGYSGGKGGGHYVCFAKRTRTQNKKDYVIVFYDELLGKSDVDKYKKFNDIISNYKPYLILYKRNESSSTSVPTVEPKLITRNTPVPASEPIPSSSTSVPASEPKLVTRNTPVPSTSISSKLTDEQIKSLTGYKYYLLFQHYFLEFYLLSRKTTELEEELSYVNTMIKFFIKYIDYIRKNPDKEYDIRTIEQDFNDIKREIGKLFTKVKDIDKANYIDESTYQSLLHSNKYKLVDMTDLDNKYKHKQFVLLKNNDNKYYPYQKEQCENKKTYHTCFKLVYFDKISATIRKDSFKNVYEPINKKVLIRVQLNNYDEEFGPDNTQLTNPYHMI
jgi:hypothetical protein